MRTPTILLLVTVALMGLWGLLATEAAGQPASAPSGEENASPTAPEEIGPGEAAPGPGSAAPAGGAEGGAGRPGPEGPAPKGRPRGGLRGSWPLLLMIGGFFLLYIWMSRGRRKEQQRRQQMLNSLKKGDKVTTIGGIIGTVIEVRGDELTVKVDESSNTRMKFARWAIRGVGEAAKAENPQEARRKS